MAGSVEDKEYSTAKLPLDGSTSLPTLGDGDAVKYGVTSGAKPESRLPKARWTIFDPLNLERTIPAVPTQLSTVILPLATASFVSKMTFMWIQPLLVLGAQRPLVVGDLYEMDESRRASVMAKEFTRHFNRRRAEVDSWNTLLERVPARERSHRLRAQIYIRWLFGLAARDGTRTAGLAMALSDTFKHQFWSAGLFKIVGGETRPSFFKTQMLTLLTPDLASVCTPLITRQLIYFVTDANAYRAGTSSYNPSIGTGAGLAIALFLLQLVYSVGSAQMFSRSSQVGILVRSVASFCPILSRCTYTYIRKDV